MFLHPTVSASKTKRQPIKRTNVIFVQKNGLFYISLPEKSVNGYVYPTEMVVDGDVVNRDSLYAALVNWFEELHIKVVDTYCIVSEDCLFQKILYPDAKTKTINEAERESFTDSTPYQRISYVKKVLKDGTHKIIVGNRDLFSVILHALEQNGLSVLGIFPEPSMIYEGSGVFYDGDDLGEKASKSIALYELKPAEEFSFDMLNRALTRKSLTQMTVSEAAQQPVDPIYAIWAILILIVVAAGIGYWQYAQVKQRKVYLAQERARLLQERQKQDASSAGVIPVSANNDSFVITQTPTPLQHSLHDSAQTATTSSNLDTNKIIRIQLLYSPEAQKLHEDVRTKLELSGSYLITSEIETPTSQTNKILIGPAISSAESTKLVDILKIIGVSAEVKQASIDEYDVVVELYFYNPTVPSPFATSTP